MELLRFLQDGERLHQIPNLDIVQLVNSCSIDDLIKSHLNKYINYHEDFRQSEYARLVGLAKSCYNLTIETLVRTQAASEGIILSETEINNNLTTDYLIDTENTELLVQHKCFVPGEMQRLLQEAIVKIKPSAAKFIITNAVNNDTPIDMAEVYKNLGEAYRGIIVRLLDSDRNQITNLYNLSISTKDLKLFLQLYKVYPLRYQVSRILAGKPFCEKIVLLHHILHVSKFRFPLIVAYSVVTIGFFALTIYMLTKSLPAFIVLLIVSIIFCIFGPVLLHREQI